MMMENEATSKDMQTDVTARVRQRNRTERNLKGDTSYFCLSEHLADVWFACKDDSTKLPAHKLLLSMRSEVFEAMFYRQLGETSDTITVEDIDVPTMRIILRYIYSDDVSLNSETVTDCLYAAKKYALYDLADKCTEFLTNAIGVETAGTIYEQAKVYDEFRLKAKCIEFITDNAKDVLSSRDFHSLSFESVLEITKNENLSCEESVFFEAVVGWGESECKRKELQVSPETIRACIGDILFMIRFPLMQIDIFAKKVVPTGILTSEEMLLIYNHLAVKPEERKAKSVGMFSNSKRNIVQRFNHLNLQPHYQGCIIILSTSNPILMTSIQGDFVLQVQKVNVLSGQNELPVTFNKQEDWIHFCEPIELRPKFGNVQITFIMNSADDHSPNTATWSTSVNVSRATETSSVNIRRIPCILKALTFKNISDMTLIITQTKYITTVRRIQVSMLCKTYSMILM